jgi:hypothetical protein
MSLLALCCDERRELQNDEQNWMMGHSVESFNYLKLSPENFMVFECSKPGKRVLSINQEYYMKTNEFSGNTFKNLYKVELTDLTLRELLVLKSLNTCNTLSELVNLIDDQDNPNIFYKSCLELDSSNMTSILSFDSRSINFLLDDKFSEYFSSEYPLFYKNRIQKKEQIFYRNAIESALRSNQVASMTKIIDFVVKYQNNYTSSFLFTKIFTDMIEKGISMKPLLDSKIFYHQFDFEEWPQNHDND